MYNIFCIWSGNNSMSGNRQKNLKSIIDNSSCNVTLITPKNLKDFEILSNPIHPAYEFLSLTHRADYLRAYLMHNYGGGYTDIKYMKFNWTKYFDVLNNNSNLLFVGYAEKDPSHISSNDIKIISSFNKLCGCGHFIFRQKTEFTTLWLNEVNSILDSKMDLLKQYPGHYHPRATTGGAHDDDMADKNSKYPLQWNEILGRIIHKLMYSFQNEYLCCMPYPNLYSYR